MKNLSKTKWIFVLSLCIFFLTMGLETFFSQTLSPEQYYFIKQFTIMISGFLGIIFFLLCKLFYKRTKISSKNPDSPTLEQTINNLTFQSSLRDKALMVCYLIKQISLAICFAGVELSLPIMGAFLFPFSYLVIYFTYQNKNDKTKQNKQTYGTDYVKKHVAIPNKNHNRKKLIESINEMSRYILFSIPISVHTLNIFVFHSSGAYINFIICLLVLFMALVLASNQICVSLLNKFKTRNNIDPKTTITSIVLSFPDENNWSFYAFTCQIICTCVMMGLGISLVVFKLIYLIKSL